MNKFLKRLREGWKRFAHRLGRIQTVIIVTVFYFVVIAPLGGLFRLFGWDPLHARGFNSKRSSNWQAVKDKTPNIETLRRQS